MYAASESMKAYRSGREAFLAGDFDGASTAFRWAAGLDPDNPIYCHAAAKATARNGDEHRAELLFLRALSATRRSLGDAHPFMLLVARDLAAHYKKSNRQEDMARFARQAIAGVYPRALARSGDKAIEALGDLWAMAE